VLGADNAIIIALVCRTLPRHQRLNVMIVGTGAALLLRIILTAATGALLFAPFLRIAGGLVLLIIAMSLTDEFDLGPTPVAATGDGKPRDKTAESELFWDAILLVVLADGVMSLDNTVALAAVAKGDVLYLMFGLALSVPTLVFGSWLLSELLAQTPFLATVAMAVLAWIAGGMVASDPWIADWIGTSAPALTFAVPIAAVVFVLGTTAFKPVIVPVPVAGPLDAFEFAGVGGPDAITPVAEAWGEDAGEAETTLVLVPTPARSEVADVASEPNDAAPPPDAAPAMKRPREERLVIIGLIALFGVAAVIISSAIYFGGATF